MNENGTGPVAMREMVFKYLELLRESGVTNMWGSPAYLREEFGFTKSEARDWFFAWMDHKNSQRSSDRYGVQ